MNSKLTKLYIIKLRFKSWEKKMFYRGEDSDFGTEQFKKAIIEVDLIGEVCNDWIEFLAKADEVFKNHGFRRVDS